jgi:hypothetical protein
MAAGTPTESDSYWLSQSTVFAHRVQVAMIVLSESVENEAITGTGGTMPTLTHEARVSFVKTIQNPSQAATWLPQFIEAAAADPTLIAAATVAATNYTPITSVALGDAAAAEGGPVTTALVNNALSAAFDTFVPGI